MIIAQRYRARTPLQMRRLRLKVQLRLDRSDTDGHFFHAGQGTDWISLGKRDRYLRLRRSGIACCLSSMSVLLEPFCFLERSPQRIPVGSAQGFVVGALPCWWRAVSDATNGLCSRRVLLGWSYDQHQNRNGRTGMWIKIKSQTLMGSDQAISRQTYIGKRISDH